jgi:hypothetical protein
VNKDSEKVRKWQKANPEKHKAIQKAYYERMKIERPEYLAERYRKRNYKSKYKITLDHYNLMLKDQNSVCYICNGLDNNKNLSVDHCHKTGKVRKLLCTRCNITLEYIENSKVDISQYLRYINEHQNQEQ